jgi:AAA+ ATPase superfamily predicted ATPase
MRDLEYLNRLCRTDKFQFAVMYGRRRVGKTALLTEFIRDKPAIFISAQEYDSGTALSLFSEKAYRVFRMGSLPPFSEWADAFAFVAKKAGRKRVIIILDEFPYLVAANKALPSIIQNAVDHVLSKTRIFLIICGSSISFMERGVLSEKSPLYGRLTSQMKIEPFDYAESALFFPHYKNEEKAAAYGFMGGIPHYLKFISDKKSLAENMTEAVLSKPSALYEEPRNLLKEELRQPIAYNSIIEAIATGRTKLNEIATKTNMPRDKCLKYIRSLLELHIVKRETPAGERAGKRSLYRLTDNFFKFWYAFVFENSELVEQGNGAILYRAFVEPALSEYMGANVFETICTDFLRRINGKTVRGKKAAKLPFVFTGIGRWWGSDPKEKIEIEIDILAYHKDEALFCECKWTNKPVGTDILETLESKASRIVRYTKKHYALFAKSGFSPPLKRIAAARNNVLLFDLNDLYAESGEKP